MSAQSFELTLARLYTDTEFRALFLASPWQALADCDLSEQERAQFLLIDKAGLIMASHSFLHKRKKRATTVWAKLAKFFSLTSRRITFHVPHV